MSGSTEQKTSQQTSPWGPQAGALTSAFSKADTAYDKASTAVAPTDFTAQFTPDQLSAFKRMVGYSGNSAVPDAAAGASTALTGAGTNATTGALSGLGSYDPTQLNSAGALTDAANKYVAGQNIDGQVNDAMLNARQTARDVTMPGIEQNAAMTGNTNSSRTGIADGMVERALAEQATNLGSTLRNSAFSHGLDLAETGANSNNSAMLAALLGRAGAGTSAVGTGVNAGSTSINDQGNLFNMANAGGAGEQAAQQAALDNALQQYQSQTGAPFDALSKYMGIVGSQNWGANSTGTSSSSTTPSAWQVIGGLLGAGGSAAGTAGGLGWKPFS